MEAGDCALTVMRSKASHCQNGNISPLKQLFHQIMGLSLVEELAYGRGFFPFWFHCCALPMLSVFPALHAAL